MDWRDELIKELREEIVRLKERIAELERRLGLDSSNSGKPPSSDGLKKALRVQSLREKSGKKPGGQFGHKGVTLEQANPDFVEQHSIDHCPHCMANLTLSPVIDTRVRQVFDIPRIRKPFVTEHRFEIKRCPTCRRNVEVQINGIAKTPVQYGPNIKAATAYLQTHNLIPDIRTTEIMNTLFGTQLSVATVKGITRTCATKVKPAVEKIGELLIESAIKGADESSIRINGKTEWLHTLCNGELVYYRTSEKRGDVPQDIPGVVVHDHFASYYSKSPNGKHALCNAHHLRELKAVSEIDKESWAKNMTRVLLIGLRMTQEEPNGITAEWLKKFKNLYQQVIAKGLAYHERLGVLNKPSRGRIKRRPGHNLLLRLQNRSEDVLRFLDNPTVPFTNNQSERALRMIKVKLKISGCFRTTTGAQDFLNIRSYTATAQKQRIEILDALASVFQGSPINFA